jgi:hypothetical protein
MDCDGERVVSATTLTRLPYFSSIMHSGMKETTSKVILKQNWTTDILDFITGSLDSLSSLQDNIPITLLPALLSAADEICHDALSKAILTAAFKLLGFVATESSFEALLELAGVMEELAPSLQHNSSPVPLDAGCH